MFWLATTDHDLAEVNHVAIPASDGARRELSISTKGVDDAPVGTVTFGDEIEPVVQEAAALLGDAPVVELLRETYRPGKTWEAHLRGCSRGGSASGE